MDILGLHQENPEWYQVFVRAIIVFVTALVYIRISGIRTLGTKSAFDVVVTITLGALLSRAITGHYPFFNCLGAAGLLVILHRLVSYLSTRYSTFRQAVSGSSIILFENNSFLELNMRKACLSVDDVIKSLHENNLEDFSKVSRIILETDGEISIIKT